MSMHLYTNKNPLVKINGFLLHIKFFEALRRVIISMFWKEGNGFEL